MLGSVKVLISKDDLRDYRGAGVKRTTVTAIECISADGRSLLPLIIWPASTGPRIQPLDGISHIQKIDTTTPKLAWSGLRVYLIPKPKD